MPNEAREKCARTRQKRPSRTADTSAHAFGTQFGSDVSSTRHNANDGSFKNQPFFRILLEEERNPIPLLTTKFIEGHGRFSPDGRYIAYVSNESGTYEVYVRPFSADGKVGGQQMISQGGGVQPQWRHNGKELFYITTDSKLAAVPVSTPPTFQRTGAPVALLTVPFFGKGFADVQRWAAMPDGQKFLINSVRPEAASEPITVILNWMELLKK